MQTPAEANQPADLDRAQYLAFSRTWAASAQMCPHDQQTVQARTIDFFRGLCRRVQPTVVLEIGAHEASFSRWAAAELAGARVTAFEANPYVHEKYVQAVTAAGVDYLNLAVGPDTPEVTLNVPLRVGRKDRALTSRMASLAVHTRASSSREVAVPAVRLDDHVDVRPDDRVVAWIDVEGANEVVLGSGPAVLARTKALYIEVESETNWEGQWLDTDVAAALRDRGMVPIARDLSPRSHQYNVVYVDRELALEDSVTREAAKVLRKRTQGQP